MVGGFFGSPFRARHRPFGKDGINFGQLSVLARLRYEFKDLIDWPARSV